MSKIRCRRRPPRRCRRRRFEHHAVGGARRVRSSTRLATSLRRSLGLAQTGRGGDIVLAGPAPCRNRGRALTATCSAWRRSAAAAVRAGRSARPARLDGAAGGESSKRRVAGRPGLQRRGPWQPASALASARAPRGRRCRLAAGRLGWAAKGGDSGIGLLLAGGRAGRLRAAPAPLPAGTRR